MEDKLGTAVSCQQLSRNVWLGGDLLGLGEGHPQDKDKLEDVVEGCCMVSARTIHSSLDILTEPVGSVDGALNQSQEGEHNPVLNR